MSEQPQYRDLNASGALPERHEGRFVRVLIAAIASALLALFIWAAITPVDEITTGSGTVITQTKPERVEHPDGGIVKSVLAVSGQFVQAGERILVFDTTSLLRELEKLRASHRSLVAERQRVSFVLGGNGQVPEFAKPEELSPEELLFWAEQVFLESQIGIIEADSRAIAPAIDNLGARHRSLRRELELVENRLNRNRRGQESGAIALNSVEALEREHLQLGRTLLEVESEISQRQSALEANRLRIAEVHAKRNREAALRRNEIEEQIVSVELSIGEVQDRIARATVRATVAGTVMNLAVANPQEVVAPGDAIAEIIPVQDRVEAEVEISADRIGSVAVGMPARLKVLSYDFTRFGEIDGKVTRISPTSYLDEQGNIVFRVIVSLPQGGDAPRLANRPILPGMTVTADILTDSKKVLTYLLKPLRALGDRAFTEA